MLSRVSLAWNLKQRARGQTGPIDVLIVPQTLR